MKKIPGVKRSSYMGLIFKLSYGLYTLHGTGTGTGIGNGTRDDGFLYNTQWQGQGTIVFYCAHPLLYPYPAPGPVQCVWAISQIEK